MRSDGPPGVSQLLPLIHREFDVALSIQAAWDHLARVDRWPSWARHIRRIDVEPPLPLCASTAGRIRLTNGITSTFRMSVFDPPRVWTWVGPLTWLAIEYEHRFEPQGHDRTRLIWEVRVGGFAAATLGRVFAAVYQRNLDLAIPRLIEEMAHAATERPG